MRRGALRRYRRYDGDTHDTKIRLRDIAAIPRARRVSFSTGGNPAAADTEVELTERQLKKVSGGVIVYI